MTDMLHSSKWFDPKISIGTIITVAAFVVTMTLGFAELHKESAVQQQRIDDNRALIVNGLERERELTRDSDNGIRRRMEDDRAEMRRQFDKINEKLDKIIIGEDK